MHCAKGFDVFTISTQIILNVFDPQSTADMVAGTKKFHNLMDPRCLVLNVLSYVFRYYIS